MNRFVYLLPALTLFVSCSNESEQKVDSSEMVDTVDVADLVLSEPPYNVEFDSITNILRLERNAEKIGDANAGDIINLINKKNQGIKLDLVKAGTDTIQLKIDDATMLTQQMGSTGAEAYLAELTYSLTELKGVKAINISFDEGDHAMPGVYTRDDFKNLAGK